MNRLAPITLFVYNRPWHTKETIQALEKNFLAKKSDLYIFSDGPKNILDFLKVDKVRKIIKNTNGFRKVQIFERPTNLGLAKSIISGITQILSTFEEIIVLEDDLISSPYFLTYMNKALSIYKSSGRVMHISGYVCPVNEKLPETFFYGETSCWGWGTWKRAWKYFDPNVQKLLEELNASGRTHEFNFEGKYDFREHLLANIQGKMKTWAIKWYASVFLHNGLCLHPGRSLINNIGFDNSGVHSGFTTKYFVNGLAKKVRVRKIPIKESKIARTIIGEFYKNQ